MEIFFAVIMLIGLTLQSCWESLIKGGAEVDLRYKVTVEVQTPEGIKTGSVIRAYKAEAYYDSLNTRYNLTENTLGEATVVDLGERGKLFETVGSRGFTNAFTKRNQDVKPIEWLKELEYLRAGQKVSSSDKSVITGQQLFAGFYNIQDPRTIQFTQEWVRCDPPNPEDSNCGNEIDSTEKLFGKGVFVKSITYEITNEPITDGEIYKALPWLKDYEEKKLRFDGFPWESDWNKQNRRFDYIGTGTFNHKPKNNGEK